MLEFFDDPAAFLAVAGDLLAGDPVVGSVIATVTERAAAADAAGGPLPAHPRWWVAVREGDTLVSACMRTAPFKPHPIFTMPMPEPAALGLARALHERGEWLGGANGALPAASVVAEETARLVGGSVRVEMHTRLFECSEVGVPPAPPGTVLRAARRDEAALCLDWFRRFGAEADEQAGRKSGHDHGEHHDLADIERRIRQDALWVLQDAAGTVCHLTGVSPPAYGVSRVGPVYTPREHRGHGYASYAVGELTRRLLDRGVRACLFTDQANPTSNGIYESLGYARVVDMVNLSVVAPAPA